MLAKWYIHRRGVIREVSSIPPSRLTFRATLETRSILEIVHHLLEYSIITVEELVRTDTNLHRASMAQLVNIYAPNITRADTQEKLVNLLVEQYRDAESRLKDLGDLHMLQLVTRLDGSRDTRFALLQESIQHEMYHRGQLTIYARLLGLVPASTKHEQSAIPGSIRTGSIE